GEGGGGGGGAGGGRPRAGQQHRQHARPHARSHPALPHGTAKFATAARSAALMPASAFGSDSDTSACAWVPAPAVSATARWIAKCIRIRVSPGCSVRFQVYEMLSLPVTNCSAPTPTSPSG